MGATPWGAAQERRLASLQFAWSVDVQAARWHHLFHEARRFKARSRSPTLLLSPARTPAIAAVPLGTLQACRPGALLHGSPATQPMQLERHGCTPWVAEPAARLCHLPM